MTTGSVIGDSIGRKIKAHRLGLIPTVSQTHKSNTVKIYVCVKCGVNFNQYAGMRIRAPGMGWCEEHKPVPKKEGSNG